MKKIYTVYLTNKMMIVVDKLIWQLEKGLETWPFLLLILFSIKRDWVSKQK